MSSAAKTPKHYPVTLWDCACGCKWGTTYQAFLNHMGIHLGDTPPCFCDIPNAVYCPLHGFTPEAHQRGMCPACPAPSASTPSVAKPIYTLTLVTGEVDRTHWWKNEDKKIPGNVWWLTGGGLSRPATDVEVELWKMVQAAKADSLVNSAAP